MLGEKKRTELEWTELIESVGLSLEKIWKSPFDNDEEGVVVAMLEDQSLSASRTPTSK